MEWVDGPAALAWRHGYVLLINEFSKCNPGFWVANNEMLEGKPIFIEQRKELLRPHPDSRVVVTDNTGTGRRRNGPHARAVSARRQRDGPVLVCDVKSSEQLSQCESTMGPAVPSAVAYWHKRDRQRSGLKLPAKRSPSPKGVRLSRETRSYLPASSGRTLG